MCQLNHRMLLNQIILCLCLPISFAVHAEYRIYMAELEESSWQYQGDKLNCELSHIIPRYGKASFLIQASHDPRIHFSLNMQRGFTFSGQSIDIRNISPAWRSKRPSSDLGNVKTQKASKSFILKDEAAWKLLTTLETGGTPTFQYREFSDASDRVSVTLSTANFYGVYQNFLTCMDQLIHHEFDDVKRTLLYFAFNKHHLTNEHKQRLKILSEFLKYDDNIDLSVLEGHTDNKGRRRFNKRLGLKRANAVKDYLIKQGVKKEKLRVVSHGEKRPVASNRSVSGRAKNRRVVIELR